MSHCCIVLNIINHLIDSSAPVIATTKTQTQVSQNAITNPNASPIKQIKAASIGNKHALKKYDQFARL